MEFLIKKDTPVIPHKKHWQFCVGSGHALLALRTDYTRQLKFIHDTLGIERVRFHGIFCDDMRTYTDLSMQMPLPSAQAFEEYNFNACGVAYDNVLDAGMKPFVELSFMPQKLMIRDERPKEGSFFYKPYIVPPEDHAAWARYVQAFVRFLIHRYGVEEVRTWYFEVWNEPDLPRAFWNGTRDEYFKLYETTARAVKEADAQIPVGGPATSNSKWVQSFLDYCEKNQIPVDFVSTHQYAGDPLGGVEDQGGPDDSTQDSSGSSENAESKKQYYLKLGEALQDVEDKTFLSGFRALRPDKSETTDIPNDVFIKNSQIVRRQAGSLPVFYTEWNENAIFSAYTNDTRKVAAYDVKTALDVSDNLDGSSVWCFSDIFEELHPFPQEFHGGFGILTQNGVPKPVYHALKMLHDAGDMRLDLGPDATLGEIGIAAFRSTDGLQVLLFRQKMKNLNLPKERTDVKIALDTSPAAVMARRIDETYGNPLRIWEEMGSPVSLNKYEVAELIEKSAVDDEPWPFTYENGVLTVTAELGVNDVYFFTVKN